MRKQMNIMMYEYFYKSGAMMLWNAMMLLMTSFEIEAHRRIFLDATHLLRPSTARTVPIQKYHAGAQIKKMPWCKESRCVMHGQDSSCSITVSNDFATKKNYHLALFTLKGVSPPTRAMPLASSATRVLFDGDRFMSSRRRRKAPGSM